MRPQDLIIDINAMAKNQFIAVEISPNFPYVNGIKASVQNGEKTTCVMPNCKFEKLIVKTPNGVPPIIPVGSEMPAGGVPVKFENLIVTPYINNGALGLSAKADNITVATPQNGAKNENAK